MTERNFTTIIPGWYRTRDGALAEVVQILDLNPRLTEQYPARGLIGLRQEEWTSAGSVFDDGYESSEDLITLLGAEKPGEKIMAKKTLTRWANVYKRGPTACFTTKENAEESSNGRIACVELTGEYEVEEEV